MSEEEIIVEEEVVEEETIEDTEVFEEDDRIVTIGEPEPEPEEEEHQETPGWVKKVRKVNREQEREIKRLKKQLEEKSQPVEEEIKLGAKPTLEASGFDDGKFEKDLLAWHEKNKALETQKAERLRAVEEEKKGWQTKQERYTNLKQEHSFKDFSDAEELVSDTLTKTQQGIIVQGADDPALLVYALGKNPKKLEELASIKDPVVFAFKLAKLEAQLKVTNKKAPAPEKRIATTTTGAGSADKTLDRLREKADKSGDYTELNKYKRKLRGA